MKKAASDFIVQVDGVKGICPAGETWAEQQILQKMIPVLACESACIRGDIARRVANQVAKEEPFRRACCGEAFYIPYSAMNRWLKEADKVVMVDECFLKCVGRVLDNLVDRGKIIHIDALQYYNKYCDVFYMEDIPEVERDDTAKYVTAQILPMLREHCQLTQIYIR